MDWAKYGLNDYRLVFNGDAVSAYFNNRLLFDKVPVSIKHGMVGVYAWSTTTFDVLVDSLAVAPIK